MSEKRFTVDKVGIYDNQEKKHFKFTAYDWMECDIYDCCEKLNEQQATIQSLKTELEFVSNTKLFSRRELERKVDEQQSIIQSLKEENEQLRKELKEKEEDERLYANEILELRETNKEHIKFKSLGGNY